MKIAIGQLDAVVGAFERNVEAVRAMGRRARDQGAELFVLPEQILPGYPARDFLELPEFVGKNVAALEELEGPHEWSRGMSVIAGWAQPHDGPGAGLYNAASLLHEGRRIATARKLLLPTYDVFDEGRYFDPGEEVTVVDHLGVRLAITICEDIWNDKLFWRRRRYDRDPVEEAVARGAQLVINVSASPYAVGKPALRERMLSSIAARHGVPIVYANLVGGNDALVFDGGSMVVGGDGRVLARAARFQEDLLVVDVEPTRRPSPGARARPDAPLPALEGSIGPEGCAELHDALVLGVRDYARKTGFRTAVLGLSGGIDSAVTACLAAAALGPANVTGFAMPSRFTAGISNDDAAALATTLGMPLRRLEIEPIVAGYEAALAPIFEGRPRDVTEENLQARVRGALLMAFSNKTGALLLTTGNKSELGVGYCTLYGDMCGGLGVIGDLPKQVVFALARWLNREREVVPWRTIERPPSAELRENQLDQDSLPPYERLDRILEHHIVRRTPAAEIAAELGDEAEVRRVLTLVLRSEFKRRQAAPVLRVTARAFGEGWRFPIAHGFRYGA